MTKFRIDDIGASTKYYNQHGRKWFTYHGKPYCYFPFADIGPLKRTWPFKKWARYEEITADEWGIFLKLFEKHAIKPIIAITACWVDDQNKLTPFPEKFPVQAEILKQAYRDDKIEVANHGLTHCIVGQHLPKFWTGNRQYHREFWPWVEERTHREHIVQSQEILEDYFDQPITTFVPPGNVWSVKTYRSLKNTNLGQVISKNYMLDSKEAMKGIDFIDDKKGFFNFHDRELKLYGTKWLLEKINLYA